MGRAVGLRRHVTNGAGRRVTVVRGMARRGDHVLLLRRAPGDRFEGHLEPPGGKVDELGDGRSEHPVAALRREFHEESGLQLIGEPQLLSTAHRVTPTGKQIEELTFEVQVADGDPSLSHEHDAHVWQPLHAPAPGPMTDAAHDGLAALRNATA